MPCNGSPYGIKDGYNQGIIQKIRAPLLWHTNPPPLYAYEPFLLGVGVVFNLLIGLEQQNRTIAIASDFCVDGTKSPPILQKEGVSGSEIAARNRKSLAAFHRTLKSQCSIALHCL